MAWAEQFHPADGQTTGPLRAAPGTCNHWPEAVAAIMTTRQVPATAILLCQGKRFPSVFDVAPATLFENAFWLRMNDPAGLGSEVRQFIVLSF